jgi:hypothetical protein
VAGAREERRCRANWFGAREWSVVRRSVGDWIYPAIPAGCLAADLIPPTGHAQVDTDQQHGDYDAYQERDDLEATV